MASSSDNDLADGPVRSLLADHRDAVSQAPSQYAGPTDHVEEALLVLQASGELPDARATQVTAHLTVCDDGRCVARIRELAAGLGAAHDALRAEPAPTTATGEELERAASEEAAAPRERVATADALISRIAASKGRPPERASGGPPPPPPLPSSSGGPPPLPAPAALPPPPAVASTVSSLATSASSAPPAADAASASGDAAEPTAGHTGAQTERGSAEERALATDSIRPSSSPAEGNVKVARTIRVREGLWQLFTQMAQELECSVDYLVGESMKHYARQRSYSPRAAARDGAAKGDGDGARSEASPETRQGVGSIPPVGLDRSEVSSRSLDRSDVSSRSLDRSDVSARQLGDPARPAPAAPPTLQGFVPPSKEGSPARVAPPPSAPPRSGPPSPGRPRSVPPPPPRPVGPPSARAPAPPPRPMAPPSARQQGGDVAANPASFGPPSFGPPDAATIPPPFGGADFGSLPTEAADAQPAPGFGTRPSPEAFGAADAGPPPFGAGHDGPPPFAGHMPDAAARPFHGGPRDAGPAHFAGQAPDGGPAFPPPREAPQFPGAAPMPMRGAPPPGAPQQGYGPQPQFQGHQQQQQQQYAPQQGYGAPTAAFGPHGYGQQGYGAPQYGQAQPFPQQPPQYGAPPGAMPDHGSAPPPPMYGQPPMQYGAPMPHGAMGQPPGASPYGSRPPPPFPGPQQPHPSAPPPPYGAPPPMMPGHDPGAQHGGQHGGQHGMGYPGGPPGYAQQPQRQASFSPPPPPMGMPGPAMHAPPMGGGMQPGPQGAPGTLAAYYEGRRVAIEKDRFIIGRGKQSTDLLLKDPNVSRQHAMVELAQGTHFIVDMGSTNGVEFHGQRISRKAIEEGDVYSVCGHEIRFSFR